MFSDRLALQVAAAAKAAGIPEAGMLAIVEVETSGSPLEADGRTPTFLFERHVFYRELRTRQPDKLQTAISRGLAIPHWSKATQYRDERTSAMRLDLLEQVEAVDEDCALRSCSWGLPQIMGGECAEVGFSTAKELVDYLTQRGVPGHIEVMIRFLKHRNLISAIDREDWPYVALRYNGAGYRENQYDTRLAAANRKWQRRLPTLVINPPQEWPESSLSRDEVEQVQRKLRNLDYPEAGEVDGIWGTRTIGAISAFQAHEGLTVTGHYDATTRDALNSASPRPVGAERGDATADDLRDAGSTTVAAADNAATVGKIKVIGGSTIAVGAVAEQATTAITGAQDAVDKVGQVKGLWSSIHDILHPFLGHPMIIVLSLVLVVTGFLIWHYAGKIILSRLGDHRDGTHAGRFT